MTTQAKSQYKGVTPPISTSAPTQAELAANDALIAELKRQNNYESKAETDKRAKVLESLQKITEEFVRVVSRKKNLPDAVVKEAGGKIFTYGSFRLGVFGPGSDIDTLVVAPKHVDREDFFEDFPDVLDRLAPTGAIEDKTIVKDAFVPIIKLVFSGISIDLIFAHLAVSTVPPGLTLTNVNLLRGLDERDLRSVNGTRVTDNILELVPHVQTFRTALRGIKLWAQRRAIYSNVMGFPGGVAWAMLVARVCQLYPQATGAVIIGKFFRIIGNWAWPQPVQLKELEDGPLQVRVWNPALYKGDTFHLMPVITPAYPQMCATHNITRSTLKIITRELGRGGDITDKIFFGKLAWRDLFAKHIFFTEGYKYYLSIIAASRTKEAQLIWSGLVESKVRLLVPHLENEGSIKLAHPFNKGFDRVHYCNSEEEIQAVCAGDLGYQAPNIKTETTDVAKDPVHQAAAQGDANGMAMPSSNDTISINGMEKQTIYTTTYYIGLELNQEAQKRLDISAQTREFKEICTSWQNYDEELNSLNVVHTRNYDLPADVFEPGEVKPTRPKKRVIRKVESAAKKRSFDANEAEETSQSQNDLKRRRPETNGAAISAG